MVRIIRFGYSSSQEDQEETPEIVSLHWESVSGTSIPHPPNPENATPHLHFEEQDLPG
jgi:hypothetical protein